MRLKGGLPKTGLPAFPALCALACIAVALACASIQGGGDTSFADECRHCHGANLQGIHGVRAYCGRCHDLAPIAPGEVSEGARREVLHSEPHVHKTANLFKSTPSCFNCHRRDWSDF